MQRDGSNYFASALAERSAVVEVRAGTRRDRFPGERDPIAHELPLATCRGRPARPCIVRGSGPKLEIDQQEIIARREVVGASLHAHVTKARPQLLLQRLP